MIKIFYPLDMSPEQREGTLQAMRRLREREIEFRCVPLVDEEFEPAFARRIGT